MDPYVQMWRALTPFERLRREGQLLTEGAPVEA